MWQQLSGTAFFRLCLKLAFTSMPLPALLAGAKAVMRLRICLSASPPTSCAGESVPVAKAAGDEVISGERSLRLLRLLVADLSTGGSCAGGSSSAELYC